MKQGLQITSDISRQLPSKNFEEGSNISVDVPRDSVYKHILVRLGGAVSTTYASGTPVADDESTMGRLVNSIEVVSNGSFTIKQVRPYMLHLQNLLATGQFGVRRASAGASAVDYPTSDGKFVYGTTTQFTSVAEAVLISFENVLAGRGRMSTLWDTRGLASAELKISTNTFSNLRAFGNTAAVTYGSSTMQFDFETIESQNIPQGTSFSAWKQTTKQVDFSAQVNDSLIDINRGNYLQGLMILARDGAAGSATTATGKVLSNTLLTDLKLIINGTSFLQNTKFRALQDKNRSRYGLNADFVSDKSLLDGCAYMDLLTPLAGEKYGALETAQNVQAPNVDQVQLSVSTDANADYTNPASIKILTNEIVKPV